MVVAFLHVWEFEGKEGCRAEGREDKASHSLSPPSHRWPGHHQNDQTSSELQKREG